MRVFVSWSGKTSHAVATALKDWLPSVIQAVDVFLSSEDIEKGSRWFGELGQVLEESDYGILCLTRSNMARPWILYEAGAISRSLAESHVTPLLIGLTTRDLEDPLGQFNATTLDEADIKRLVISINKQLGDERLTEKQLDRAFKAWWPDLQAKLKAIGSAPPETRHRYDVFLSTPMASLASDDEYKAFRKDVMQVFDALKAGGLSVYWSAEKIESMDDWDALDVSVTQDFGALDESRTFMLIYTQKLVTSALVEAGYALARGIESHYFVSNRADLPFLMRELPGPVDTVTIHTQPNWRDCADLARKVQRYRDPWFFPEHK